MPLGLLLISKLQHVNMLIKNDEQYKHYISLVIKISGC